MSDIYRYRQIAGGLVGSVLVAIVLNHMFNIEPLLEGRFQIVLDMILIIRPFSMLLILIAAGALVYKVWSDDF